MALARLSRLCEEMARNPDLPPNVGSPAVTQPAQIPVAVPSAEVPPVESEVGRGGVRCSGEEARPFFVGAFFRRSSGEPERRRVGESSDFGQSISNDAHNDRPGKFSGHFEQQIQPF